MDLWIEKESGKPMKRRRSLASAIILIGVGAFYLAVALIPGVRALAYGKITWPFQIIALGLLFFATGIITFSPALFIPGTIITGIGGILYYQNSTGNWSSWSYMWALIPGFVGFGLILFGIFARKFKAIWAGLWNILFGLICFSVFGYALGHLLRVEVIWPAIIILLGFFFLLRAVRRNKAAE